MRVQVYFNRYGRIVSLIELKTDPEAPPAGVFPSGEYEHFETELTDEQAKLPLIALHTTYGVELVDGRPVLAPLARRSETKRRSKREGNRG